MHAPPSITYLLFLLGCSLCCHVAAQPREEIAHFSLENGLSDRTVTSICQDGQGFLWIGTANGLNRFDGYHFLTYDVRPRSRHKIANSLVEYLMTDRKGHLLVFSGKKSYDVLDPLTGMVATQFFEEKNGYEGERIIERKGTDGSVYSLSLWDGRSLIYRFDEKIGKFAKLLEGPQWLARGVAFLDFIPANDGSFWFAYEGLFHEIAIIQTDATGRILHVFDNGNFTVAPHVIDNGVRIMETSNGEIWLSILSDGVFVLDAGAGVFRPHPNLPKGNFIFDKDSKGNALVYKPKVPGLGSNAYLFLTSGQRLDYSKAFENQPLVNTAFSTDFAAWLLIGSNDGLSRHWFRSSRFANFLKEDLQKKPFGMSVRGMAKDGQGRLLIGTEKDGIFEMNLLTNTLSRPSERSPQLEVLDTIRFTRTLFPQGDSVVWIPFQYGLIKYWPAKNQVRRYEIGGLPDGIALTADGRLWLATMEEGLLAMNLATGEISSYKNKDGRSPLEGLHPSYLIADHDGVLWLGTYSEGLVKIDVKNGTSQQFTANEGDPAMLNSNAISCIYEAISLPEEGKGGGLLWVGTVQGGLHLFDPAKGNVTAIYTQENGLSHNSVAGIQPDGKGNLWISTYGGLSFFDTKLKTFRNYSTADGLTSNEFNRHSFCYDPAAAAGRYYFGGMNGVNAFYEKDLFQTAKGLLLLVSEASFSGGGDSVAMLTDGLVSGSTLTLPPANRFLNLRFALTDYSNPDKNQFSYKIEGLDEDWNYLGSNYELRLNHLPAGTHLLRLRGADSQGNWSSEDFYIQLIVKEFWYKRWWAWMLYAVLLAGAAYLFYRFQLQRKIAEKEARRLQELDEFKSRFFTNITHEFRTPLTVILGMAEQLAVGSGQWVPTGVGSSERPGVQGKIGLIKRNGQSLLRLINQILDLAKLESNTLKINYILGDVLPYLRYIAESLHSLANAQNVMLKVESTEAAIVMDYDPERLLSVVHNLLSNAIKFTPSGGKVTLRAATVLAGFENLPSLSLTVSDTGVGIPLEDLPKIFDRFFQADNSAVSSFPTSVGTNSTGGGTGIGLSLTKELVKAMDGEIGVESEPGKGTTFTLRLPITNAAPVAGTDLSVPSPRDKLSERLANHPAGEPSNHLLLIEDNPDVVEYLAACLGENYQLDFAYNGRAGIEKALETVPDLIISDVMMPEKDGFEVCDFLKNDERTSHVPIVLLTAKADIESRIAGLKRGADAYLAKPFHQEELLVTLANLLELRRKLQARYADLKLVIGDRTPQSPITSHQSPVTDPEDAFIQKIRSVVEKNLSDSDFEMPQLERALAMSRSQIFRKVKALTGKSPTLFVRSIRLSKARHFLETTRLTVSEIAYDTGFSSPQFFSDAFLEEFGIRPSATRN